MKGDYKLSVINMEDNKKTQPGKDQVDNLASRYTEVDLSNEKLSQENKLQSTNFEGVHKSIIPTKKDEDKAAKKSNDYTEAPSNNNSSNCVVPVATHPDRQITPTKKFYAEPKNECIFCLEGGQLIHMCTCSALTHKACALEYIRFPGANNDKCAQCREKLHYDYDRSTPMKSRYIILFTSLVVLYCTMFGVSVWLTTLMIPSENLNTFLYVCIVANLSILWPLILVFIVVWGLEASLGPYDRTRSTCNDPGCYWSGDCGGGNCDCCDSGGGDGDACAIVLCVLLLVAILVLMIAATWWLIISLTKFYKSFQLKSKKMITFRDEKRTLNTLGFQKPTVSALVTKQPSTRSNTVIEEV